MESDLIPPNTVDPAKEASRREGELVKPFTEHLEDLRKVLIKSLLAVGVVCAVCFFFTERIVAVYEWPLTSMLGSSPQGVDAGRKILRSLSPADAFMVSLKAVVVTGLILASPVVFYLVWSFVRPGLTDRERRVAIPIFAGGTVCFLTGVAFCYFVVLRLALGFFWRYTMSMGVDPDWTIGNYMSFTAMFLLSFGIIFEMPVLSAFLAWLGLVSGDLLTKNRRYAYVILVFLAAVLTPGPDFVSTLLMLGPMVILYELSIRVIRMVEKRGMEGKN